MWEWHNEFDLLLYLDADTLAVGRAEATLDHFAPNGTAPHPLGAAPTFINEGRTFNAGVLAVQPSRAFFSALMAAGETLEYHAGFAEQAFLNAYLSKAWGYMRLPQICNLESAWFKHGMATFKRDFPRALVLHYVAKPKVRVSCGAALLCQAAERLAARAALHCQARGRVAVGVRVAPWCAALAQLERCVAVNGAASPAVRLLRAYTAPSAPHRPLQDVEDVFMALQGSGRARLQVMLGRVRFNEAKDEIVGTTDGRAGDVLDALWVNAWSEARRLLGLPMPPPSSATVREIFGSR
jgi:hypothetical protein